MLRGLCRIDAGLLIRMVEIDIATWRQDDPSLLLQSETHVFGVFHEGLFHHFLKFFRHSRFLLFGGVASVISGWRVLIVHPILHQVALVKIRAGGFLPADNLLALLFHDTAGLIDKPDIFIL